MKMNTYNGEAKNDHMRDEGVYMRVVEGETEDKKHYRQDEKKNDEEQEAALEEQEAAREKWEAVPPKKVHEVK